MGSVLASMGRDRTRLDDAWRANSPANAEARRAVHEECAWCARARIWRRCWRACTITHDTVDTLPHKVAKKTCMSPFWGSQEVNRGLGDPHRPGATQPSREVELLAFFV